MRRSTVGTLLSCVLLLLASPSGAEAGLSFGVAPFEGVAAPGVSLPDVAGLLAERLGADEEHRVVGPARYGAPAAAEPSAESVRAWAEQVDVAMVVVGRTTRLGGQLSLDVRLRDGVSGDVIGTYVEEVPAVGGLDSALDAIAQKLVAGARRRMPANMPAALAPLDDSPVPESTPAATSATSATVAPGGGGFGLDRSKPMAIRSEELEAFESDEGRRLVFSRKVEVEQGGVRIFANRLEAFYAPDESQPERLVAEGSVRMIREGREARCDRATYWAAGNRLECRGNAELLEGDDRVSGEVIEFDLARETVKVRGSTVVILNPDGERGSPPVEASE